MELEKTTRRGFQQIKRNVNRRTLFSPLRQGQRKHSVRTNVRMYSQVTSGP